MAGLLRNTIAGFSSLRRSPAITSFLAFSSAAFRILGEATFALVSPEKERVMRTAAKTHRAASRAGLAFVMRLNRREKSMEETYLRAVQSSWTT